MGLFSKMKTLTGSVDRNLLETGILGFGVVLGVERTGISLGAEDDPSQVYVFTVEVAIDQGPRYTATCRQAVRATRMPRLMLPGAGVAVRVDPADYGRIVLSLGEDAPVVSRALSRDSLIRPAARIRRLGAPCRVAVVEAQPLGMRNQRGEDMYAFTLSVDADGRDPYQARVGSPVPAAALPLLYTGSTLPAKRMPAGDMREIVIDWQAALAREAPAGSATPAVTAPAA
jgi:hypothetical protein